MRSVKLSLVAAMAAGSFSALCATPLEDAIRGVDISGAAWYRYESGQFTNGSDYNLDAGGITFKQTHRFKAWMNTRIGVGDGFTVFGQLMYWANVNDGYGGYNNANTKEPIILRQAGIEYFNPDAAGLKISLGRQALGTIWTDDMAGMAAKVSVRPTEGVNITAFAVDSFETNDGDKVNPNSYSSGIVNPNDLYNRNLYGAAFLGDFGPAKLQVWAAYWDERATFYALKFNFGTRFGEEDEYGYKLNIEYLGNAVDTDVKGDIYTNNTLGFALDNGNLIHARGTLNVGGFDAFLGGAFYGKKGKFTINTFEEAFIGGDANTFFGKEITYQKGSWMALSAGRNLFGYVGLGYRIVPSWRFGIQGVFGATNVKDGTMSAAQAAALGGGDKYELVAESTYQLNNKLDFLIYYSYLNTKASNGVGDGVDAESSKNTVRFQARYKF